MSTTQRLSEAQLEGWWDIARPGSWQGSLGGRPATVELTRRELEEMAESYDPALLEAPITLEHHRQGPAHGWVAALRVKGDCLQARFKELSAELRQWLKSGAYRSRSIELYRPFEGTGRAYLAAVSFLGAAAPAVKGLAPEPSLLAEGETVPAVLALPAAMVLAEPPCPEARAALSERSIAERVLAGLRELLGAPLSDQPPAAPDEEPASEPDLSARLASLQAELEAERAARAAAEAELAALREELARGRAEAEFEQFTAALEEALRQGRLLPAELKGCLCLAARLDQAGRRAVLAELAERPSLALFRELAPRPESPVPPSPGRARFEGFPEDPEHDQALQLMSAEPGLAFAEALERVRLTAVRE